jgi:hypothetical protein
MPWQDLLEKDADYECWIADGQKEPPSEGWRAWLMMAGRGFGKTRAGAEWINRLASGKRGLRIALVGASIADARSIMVEGVSGLLAVAKANRRRLVWEPSLGRLKWPNGSEAQLFSGDHADGLRGPEHDFVWVLTFELIADADAPNLNELLADVSGGIIQCDAGQLVDGYAALGSSIKAAIGPLIDFHSVALFDDGQVVRSPGIDPAIPIPDADFGNSADAGGVARLEREQTSARNLPAALTLSFYDPERDYQTGQTRASANDQFGIEERNDLPVVLTAQDARALAEDLLAKRWAKRDKLTLRLPPKFLGLEPGTTAEIALSPTRWTVEQVTIDALAAVIELRPVWHSAAALPADSGRSLPPVDELASAISLALVELPNLNTATTGDPTLYLAAASSGASARRAPVELSASGWVSGERTSAKKAVMGQATTALGTGQSCLLDLSATVDVQLVDADQWLTSCDDYALVQGTNLALLGDELIQFGSAEPLGPGEFRLTRLTRGRAGTEWAIGGHAAGDRFILIERETLQPIVLPAWIRGSNVLATQQGISGGVTAVATVIVSGDSVRPLAPVNLTGTIDGAGDLQIAWVRRSRQGLGWVDDVDAPLGESSERYEVIISGASGAIAREAPSPAVTIPHAELAALGSGPATIAVRQIGDWAGSRSAETAINLA